MRYFRVNFHAANLAMERVWKYQSEQGLHAPVFAISALGTHAVVSTGDNVGGQLFQEELTALGVSFEDGDAIVAPLV